MDDVLRSVGPEDIDSGGELAGPLGAHNRGQQLITEVARSKPPAVTRAQSRPEDVFRSRFLQEKEVESAIEDEFSDLEITRVLSARVKGKGSDPEGMQVVVLAEYPSGRTGRLVLPYKSFKKSAKAHDDAVKSGAFDPYVDEDDPKELRKQLAAARKAADVEAGRGRPAGSPVGPAGAEVTTPGDAANAAALADEKVSVIEDRIPDLSEEELDALEDAEKAKSKPRKTVLEAIAAVRDERENAAD